MEETGIQSRFQLQGLFWPVGKPDNKFAAHLSSDARHIELNTSAILIGPKEFFQSDIADDLDILHGITTRGSCTLIGLQETKVPAHFDGTTLEAVTWRRFRVSSCLFGCHLEDDRAPFLKAALFRYSGLSDWLPFSGAFSMTGDTLSFNYPKKPLIISDFSVISHRTHVSIKVAPSIKNTFHGRIHVARSDPRINIEPTEPQSLEWFFELAQRFENFFSLCLGTSVRTESILLTTTDDSDAWLVHHVRSKAQRTDRQAWIKCEPSELATAIASWFAAPKEFRSLESLIYGTIRHSSLFVETEFLSLAQAIESFHRLTDNTRVVEPDHFSEILRVLIEFIKNADWGLPISKRLMEAIEFANEPSFRNRIQSLLLRLTKDHVKKLLGDEIEFEQALRQTRNHLTHPGIEIKSKVLRDPKQLFLFNQKLHAFLRLLMLLNVGFRETSAFDPVYYQSRQWN